ncbi:acyltransferase family protein [Methylocapsa acidiphila]|uniref:acyltransferase family protein n=1 Tax=Methylocapsa acidiphila TaxID=133552 RepID=UPI0003F5EA3B|nr:acyltransferase [Methylocapsa acidiphila]
MTQKTRKTSKHWPLFDLLRTFAALLVLFAHSRPFYFVYISYLDQESAFLKLFYFVTGVGHEAVVIFFVLSGFLIGGSLADSMARGDFNLPRYLIARFARIYVVYIPALIITLAVFFFGSLLLCDSQSAPQWFAPLLSRPPLEFGGGSQAICFLAGLQGFACPAWDKNPVLWSLGFEWALYLFAPALIQLIVWNASLGLRLIAGALVCAIAATLCSYRDPVEAAFWFGAWFLGVGAFRLMRTGAVQLPIGLIGFGLMIAGMFLAHVYPDYPRRQIMTDVVIACGAALAVSCRPLAALPLAPRFFAWAAGFSYTLYAIHAPFVFLSVSFFQRLGFPPDLAPGPAPFMEFAITIAICLLAAFLVSLITERKTEQIRAAILSRCPPLWIRAGASDEPAPRKTP